MISKKVKFALQAIFLLFLIAGSIWVVTNSRKPAPYKKSEGQIFGTTYHITYQSNENLSNGILNELRNVDNSLSMFNPESTISLINSNKGKATDSLFREVFRLSMEIARQTDGAFDITIAPLVNAWGFGFKNKKSLGPQQIDSLLDMVGYNKVKIENDKLIKNDSRIMLDCSGIAKGYGCDRVAQFLESHNVDNYMIEIGGEIRAHGVNEQHENWTIGIVRPQDDNKSQDNTLQNVLKLTNVALATSGNYRNFYYQNGKKYAHTIDPQTGYPVQHSILSSTVLAQTCAEADAYATSFMVMGLEKAKKLLARNHRLQALLIYTDSTGLYKTWCSDSLRQSIIK